MQYRIFITGLSNDALTCFPALPNKDRSIRAYLSEKRRKLRIFSIGQIIGSSIDDCDFREKFSDYEETVAVDLDERFCDRECERLKRIEGIQRNDNPFVKKVSVDVWKW